MLSLRACLFRNRVHRESRTPVSDCGAEWIELTQQSQKFGRYLGKRKVSVDIELRSQLRRQYVLCDILLEAASEFGCSPLSSTVPRHKCVRQSSQEGHVTLRWRCTHQIPEPSAKNRGKTVGERQHNRRLVVKLGKSRRNDAYYTLMPVLIVDDYRFLSFSNVS